MPWDQRDFRNFPLLLVIMFMGSEQSYARIGWLISFQFDVGTRIFLIYFRIQRLHSSIVTSFFCGDCMCLYVSLRLYCVSKNKVETNY